MRRAYVGFSSPVGYDYRNQARKTPNDGMSSPNPILVGSMGLYLLFDEIWFPCRSICPDNMRELDYVRFVDVEYPDLKIDVGGVIDRYCVPDGGSLSLSDLSPDGYGGFMEHYYGEKGPDNHTHGLSWFGGGVNGNPTQSNLTIDLYLVDALVQLDLTPVFNGITGKCTFPNGLEYLRGRDPSSELDLAERSLCLTSLYDITGANGPYHPVVEELRNHPFISAFRRWANDEAGRLGNQDPSDILDELDRTVIDFEDRELRKAVGEGGLKETTVDLAKGIALDLIPGASTVNTTIGLIRSEMKREDRKFNAFVATSRGRLWSARRRDYRRSRP